MKYWERCSCGAAFEADDRASLIDWRYTHRHDMPLTELHTCEPPIRQCVHRFARNRWGMNRCIYCGELFPTVSSDGLVSNAETTFGSKDLPRLAVAGEKCCRSEHPIKDEICLAAKGHDGPHVAYGTVGPTIWSQS